jgi:hypothetical protein
MNNLAFSGPPPAPDIRQPLSPNGGNMLAGGPAGASPGQTGTPAQPQGAPAPAPTHEQTVAAMRHFQAIQDEIEPLLKDPDCGKSDMKSKVIDGATKLVAARIFTPADAVAQLVDLPGSPFEQRNWLIRQHFVATVGLHQVLDHHGAAVAAGMVPAGGKPKRENHIQDMAALKEHYKNV